MCRSGCASSHTTARSGCRRTACPIAPDRDAAIAADQDHGLGDRRELQVDELARAAQRAEAEHAGFDGLAGLERDVDGRARRAGQVARDRLRSVDELHRA